MLARLIKVMKNLCCIGGLFLSPGTLPEPPVRLAGIGYHFNIITVSLMVCLKVQFNTGFLFFKLNTYAASRISLLG